VPLSRCWSDTSRNLFLLVDPAGGRLSSTLWAQYGLAGVLEREAFVRDITGSAAAAGVGIEQVHPEYGANQFEIWGESFLSRGGLIEFDFELAAPAMIARSVRLQRPQSAPAPHAAATSFEVDAPRATASDTV
jgi:hypothetical protein